MVNLGFRFLYYNMEGKKKKKYSSAHQPKGMRQGENDIGKRAIPVEERCDDFDSLWNMIFDECVAYWDEVKD